MLSINFPKLHTKNEYNVIIEISIISTQEVSYRRSAGAVAGTGIRCYFVLLENFLFSVIIGWLQISLLIILI